MLALPDRDLDTEGVAYIGRQAWDIPHFEAKILRVGLYGGINGRTLICFGGLPERCLDLKASNPRSSAVFTQPVTVTLLTPAMVLIWETGHPDRAIFTAKTLK